MSEEAGKQLHIVMLPWLAMGHLLPFFELSKRLTKKGHRVSFLTSPGNLRRLPSIPPSISHLFELVPCPLPSIERLPVHVESTVDLPSDNVRPFLFQAFLSFEHHLSDFLDDPSRLTKPDWIICDMLATTWVPNLAAQHGLRCANFCLINAAAITSVGHYARCESPEELIVVPECVPFPSTVAFTPFEARKVFPMLSGMSKRSDLVYSVMAIRTCKEFEPEWLDLLGRIYKGNPIVPVGFLPPSFHGDEESEAWPGIAAWLDKKEIGSVLFAAFGSEVILTTEQIEEIAIGLEKSDLPFVWALRAGSPPDGFVERVGERGMMLEGWVPQARLLSHSSIGGFLTHGGWNSIVEGLTAGVALVVLPMQFEQGLTARHLVEKGLGVEVVRDFENGSFAAEEIASKLRMVMVEEEGEELKARARKVKKKFGDEEVQDRYMEELVKFLLEK